MELLYLLRERTSKQNMIEVGAMTTRFNPEDRRSGLDSSSVSETEPELPDPRRWIALGFLALVQFMLVLDTTVVNVALPSIQRDLHFSPSGLAWVVNAYTLTAGGFLILGGRVADLLGRRRLFMIGVALFAIASAVSGLAQDSGMLVGARFAQGLGEAIAGPAALSLALLLFVDKKERAKAVGAWGGLAGLGGTTGVVLGGIITSYLSWRWVFLINVPIAAVVLLVVPRLVKDSRQSQGGRVDFVGAFLITGGLTLIVYGLLAASTRSWGSSPVLVPLLTGAALLVAFVVSQMVIRDPLVPLRFFRNRTRVTANIATIFLTSSFISMFFVLTLYMQNVGHFSPVKAGLAYLPFGFALLAGIVVSTQVLPRIGVKVGLVIAFLLGAAGLALLGQIGVHVDYVGHILPGTLLLAFGNGMAFPALQNASLYQVDQTDAGLASGVENTFLQVGGGLGLSVIVTLAIRHSTSRVAQGASLIAANTSGYALALRIASGLCLLAAITVAVIFERVPYIAPDEVALTVAESDTES
jgi:EmrB/QacA subfamily drug resistance transporter